MSHGQDLPGPSSSARRLSAGCAGPDTAGLLQGGATTASSVICRAGRAVADEAAGLSLSYPQLPGSASTSAFIGAALKGLPAAIAASRTLGRLVQHQGAAREFPGLGIFPDGTRICRDVLGFAAPGAISGMPTSPEGLRHSTKWHEAEARPHTCRPGASSLVTRRRRPGGRLPP